MIDSFDKEYRWLSNFWPCQVEMYGDLYPSVEHAYQAAKTLDRATRRNILRAFTPGSAKRMGQKVTLRPDWDTFRLEAMEELLRRKFADDRLGEKLLATWPETLVEGNHWGDVFWGESPVGTGKNHLGRLLMKIRDELRGRS